MAYLLDRNIKKAISSKFKVGVACRTNSGIQYGWIGTDKKVKENRKKTGRKMLEWARMMEDSFLSYSYYYKRGVRKR